MDAPVHVAVTVGPDRNNVQAIISLTQDLHAVLLGGQSFVLSPTYMDGETKKLLCINLTPQEAKSETGD